MMNLVKENGNMKQTCAFIKTEEQNSGKMTKLRRTEESESDE